MKKIHLLGMMMLILSTAFIGCGKVTNDPDPKKDDTTSASLKDSILIEITIKASDNTVFERIDVMLINDAVTGGGLNQNVLNPNIVLPSNIATIKITGKEVAAYTSKESFIGLVMIGGVNGHPCSFKLINGDDDHYNFKNITLKKGLNKVTLEYEAYYN